LLTPAQPGKRKTEMKRLFGILLFVLGASFALAADKNPMKLLKAAEAGGTLAIERTGQRRADRQPRSPWLHTVDVGGQ
jgi:hypothetical protein